MSISADEDRGPPRRRPEPPRKSGSVWKWACGGCAVFTLLSCGLVTVGIVAGVNWVGDAFDKLVADTRDQPVFASHPKGSSGVTSVRFSPDGGRIASSSPDGTIKVWNAETGENVLSLSVAKNSPLPLSFSPDGTRLAIGGRAPTPPADDKRGNRPTNVGATVWDTATGKLLLSFAEGHTKGLWDVAYSPDGTRLATASEDSTVRVSDAATGKELLVLEGHSNAVLSVAFSSDGTRLVSGSRDGTVRLWDAVTGKEQRKLEIKVEEKVDPKKRDEICRAAFSGDGKRVWGAGWAHFWTWDATTGDDIGSTGHQASTERFFPATRAIHPASNQLVAANEKWAHVFDLTTGRQTQTVQTRLHILTLGIAPTKLHCVAISPDGKRVVGGSRNGTIRVWKLKE